jgi:hypothetical protein
MSQEAHTATAIFSTIPGVIGGVTKAITAKPNYLAAQQCKMLYCTTEKGFGYTLNRTPNKKYSFDEPYDTIIFQTKITTATGILSRNTRLTRQPFEVLL